jgi:diguanylate cyclase (GGDEF)-like protein
VTDDRHQPSALSALQAAVAALARESDPDATLARLVELAASAVGADRAAVLVQDPDRPELELAAGIGLSDDDAAVLRAAIADPAHPLVVAGRERRATFDRRETGSAGVAADLPLTTARDGVELSVGTATFGWTNGRELGDDDRGLLASFVDLITIAVDRAQVASHVAERSEWFERLAHTDPLTGLANARLLDRILELELARAGRQGSEVSIAIFDVDDFGATNSEAGHAAGDDVLRQVAAVLAESVRLVDTVARYGGDEFILVAPGSAGMTVARRVLDGIADLPAVAGRRISVSSGVARFPNDATGADELIEAAVRAMADAHAAGGDRVIEATLAGDGGTEDPTAT